MGDKTGISWTDATWNPVRGCSRVAARFSGPGQPYEGLIKIRKFETISYRETLAERKTIVKDATEPRWSGEVRFVAEHLADPLRWRKPRRIFVNSMSDLFHERLTNEQIAAVFGVMAAAPQHTFQVLTKRAKRMREWFAWDATKPTGLLTIRTSPRLGCRLEADKILNPDNTGRPLGTESQPNQWPLPNVWLGVSVENQAAADERIPDLLATPAAVRFLSCEPLLGEVDLRHVQHERMFEVDSLTGNHGVTRPLAGRGPGLDWVIAGCESGPGARSCSVEWLRSLRDQCAAEGTAFFLKQATRDTDRGDPVVVVGPGSKPKSGGVIELPYMDGLQHAAFPEPT